MSEERTPAPSRAGPEASLKVQILSTEHLSLLTSRSLTYGESFARVNMFFSILTGAVVALALIAQAMFCALLPLNQKSYLRFAASRRPRSPADS